MKQVLPRFARPARPGPLCESCGTRGGREGGEIVKTEIYRGQGPAVTRRVVVAQAVSQHERRCADSSLASHHPLFRVRGRVPQRRPLGTTMIRCWVQSQTSSCSREQAREQVCSLCGHNGDSPASVSCNVSCWLWGTGLFQRHCTPGVFCFVFELALSWESSGSTSAGNLSFAVPRTGHTAQTCDVYRAQGAERQVFWTPADT